MNVGETEISTLSDSVGTVFQNPRTQFFNTDTDSEIVFGLENRMLETKELKQQLERVVKDLHIEKLKGCSIFELSGGEKQKIAFARIAEEEVPLLYSNAKVNLNCSMQKAVEWGVVSLRVYQILACKGFLISDLIPAAEKQLRGKVVFSDGEHDLTEKIKYYLVHVWLF